MGKSQLGDVTLSGRRAYTEELRVQLVALVSDGRVPDAGRGLAGTVRSGSVHTVVPGGTLDTRCQIVPQPFAFHPGDPRLRWQRHDFEPSSRG